MSKHVSYIFRATDNDRQITEWISGFMFTDVAFGPHLLLSFIAQDMLKKLKPKEPHNVVWTINPAIRDTDGSMKVLTEGDAFIHGIGQLGDPVIDAFLADRS